jgi:hypothetical protein
MIGAMGHDVGITIKLQPPTEYKSSLAALEAAGWEIRDITGTSFIREDATDSADWLVFQPVAVERVRKLVATRDELDLVAGVVLMYAGTLHGGNFLWIDRNTLVVSPSINRVELAGGWIDASWYLSRLCEPLLVGGCGIESVTLHESRT